MPSYFSLKKKKKEKIIIICKAVTAKSSVCIWLPILLGSEWRDCSRIYQRSCIGSKVANVLHFGEQMNGNYVTEK